MRLAAASQKSVRLPFQDRTCRYCDDLSINSDPGNTTATNAFGTSFGRHPVLRWASALVTIATSVRRRTRYRSSLLVCGTNALLCVGSSRLAARHSARNHATENHWCQRPTMTSIPFIEEHVQGLPAVLMKLHGNYFESSGRPKWISNPLSNRSTNGRPVAVRVACGDCRSARWATFTCCSRSAAIPSGSHCAATGYYV